MARGSAKVKEVVAEVPAAEVPVAPVVVAPVYATIDADALALAIVNFTEATAKGRTILDVVRDFTGDLPCDPVWVDAFTGGLKVAKDKLRGVKQALLLGGARLKAIADTAVSIKADYDRLTTLNTANIANDLRNRVIDGAALPDAKVAFVRELTKAGSKQIRDKSGVGLADFKRGQSFLAMDTIDDIVWKGTDKEVEDIKAAIALIVGLSQ